MSEKDDLARGSRMWHAWESQVGTRWRGTWGTSRSEFPLTIYPPICVCVERKTTQISQPTKHQIYVLVSEKNIHTSLGPTNVEMYYSKYVFIFINICRPSYIYQYTSIIISVFGLIRRIRQSIIFSLITFLFSFQNIMS